MKAANALEIPRASISAAIQQLESGMGTRLLHRTTRQVRLTADGTLLLERARSLLADAEEIDQLFQVRQHKISGRLNVDVPSRIGRRLIAPALPGFLRAYPRLELMLSSSDRAIDLVQEGVDCVVRVGALQNSSLVARPLGHIALINCASPGYVREHGVPANPDDLMKGHWAVGYASAAAAKGAAWEYLGSGRKQFLDMPSRVIVNNAENYIACCLAGVGLIQIPRFDVQHLLDSGELVEVMPEFRAASMPVSLICANRKQRSRRLNAFFEWFAALMQPHLEA
ncbi:LysR substrate-binding domain-containing protein [Duganella vulcania]|uniref:LysR substrate-binding domain-containing protein n=1 Tax=Duganella vulcania TaxID=2692166 RepID=UPI0035A3CECE